MTCPLRPRPRSPLALSVRRAAIARAAALLLFWAALSSVSAQSPAPEATPAETPAATPVVPTPSPTPGLPRDLFLLPETMPSPIPMDQLSTETLKLRQDKASELIATTDAVANQDGATRLGVPLQRLRDRLDRLRDWQGQLSRQVSALEKVRAGVEAEQSASRDVEAFRLNGLPTAPPYPVATLFDVLNERDATLRGKETAELAEKGAEADLKDAVARRDQAERDWRAANEAYRLNKDAGKALALGRDLEDATIGVYRAQAAARARELEVTAAKSQLSASQILAGLAEEKTSLVLGDLSFAKAALDEKLGDVRKRREDLGAAIDTARRNIDDAERRQAEARSDRDKATGDEEIATQTARVDALERELDVARQRLAFLEDQQERLGEVEKTWNRLHSVLNGDEKEKWKDWRREADALIASLDRERVVQLTAQANQAARLAERERELKAFQDAGGSLLRGEGYWRKYRKTRLDNLGAYATENLADLENALSVVRRLVDVLTIREKQISWRDRWERFARAARGWWDYELYQVGDSPITVRKVVVAILVVVVGLTFSRFGARVLRGMVLPRFGVEVGGAAAFEKIANYVAIVIVFLIAFKVVNIPLTAFAFLGGAAAIAFGFGAQNLLNNFMSGLIVMAEQPISLGDLVEIDDILGTVEEIGGRSTRIRSVVGKVVFVPNSELVQNRVVNWTRNPYLRLSIKVGVAYGSPVRQVSKILRDILDRHGKIESTPEPIVIFQDFADNSLVFEMIFWIRIGPLGHDGRLVSSDLRHMIYKALTEAGVEISFPQRDVHLDAAKPIPVVIVAEKAPAAAAASAPTEQASAVQSMTPEAAASAAARARALGASPAKVAALAASASSAGSSSDAASASKTGAGSPAPAPAAPPTPE